MPLLMATRDYSKQNRLFPYCDTSNKLKEININNLIYRLLKKFKSIDAKNRTQYRFDDMINIKNLDPNKIKVDEKSYENILIHYIVVMWHLRT